MKKKEKPEMSPSVKKKILSHIKADSKEFKSQLADDKKLRRIIKTTKGT